MRTIIVVVYGSRHWNDAAAIEGVLDELGGPLMVLHGDCRGADKMAERIARERGWYTEAYPADWKRYGKRAGPIRNREMIQASHGVDMVLAFHEDLSQSRGTRDMIFAANKAGIEVRLYPGP